MDLSMLDTRALSEEGSVMQVLHPRTSEPVMQDDGTPVTIRLAGQDSDRFRKMQRTATNRRLKSGRRVELTAEQIDRDGLEALVACTVDWSGVELDGQFLDCTPHNVRTVFERLPWLRQQADEFVMDRANFLRDSPTT